MAEYSPSQENAGTDVGPTGRMPTPAMPATPDVAGKTGPPTRTVEPSAGRFEPAKESFTTAVDAYSAAMATAYANPGQRVDSMVVPPEGTAVNAVLE